MDRLRRNPLDHLSHDHMGTLRRDPWITFCIMTLVVFNVIPWITFRIITVIIFDVIPGSPLWMIPSGRILDNPYDSPPVISAVKNILQTLLDCLLDNSIVFWIRLRDNLLGILLLISLVYLLHNSHGSPSLLSFYLRSSS